MSSRESAWIAGRLRGGGRKRPSLAETPTPLLLAAELCLAAGLEVEELLLWILMVVAAAVSVYTNLESAVTRRWARGAGTWRCEPCVVMDRCRACVRERERENK